MQIDTVSEIRSFLGEGPIYDERSNVVVWTDIEGRRLHRYQISSCRSSSWTSGGMVSALIKRRSGGFYAAVEEGFGVIRGRKGYEVTLRNLDLLERMNDAKCDSRGRIWAGSTDRSFRKGHGKLHRLDTNMSHQVMLENLVLPNGIDWSPDDSRMYLIDSLEHVLWAFDFDAELGQISNRNTLFEFSEELGIPDGISVSAEGDIFVAMWDGAQIMVISNTGEKLDCLKVPVRRPTSCVFGGEGFDELYVSSASMGLSLNQDSQDGFLLKISGLGVKGKASNFFNG